MRLSPGTRLGPYEIEKPLGAGGMGEVYRALDTRLHRVVAVKVLPGDFAQEPGVRARFDREARLISQLSHPNICALYDIGEHEGSAYIVMECLEGETLAERLRRDSLPITQALQIAVEISTALNDAHRHGIVHRDLKPSNVMLARSGVKLLDFGIAKTAVAETERSDAVTTEPLTRAGAVLGTPRYMAPEQVRGAPTDHRTDIFALGVLLYEMTTGQPAFDAGSDADAMAAILTRRLPKASSQQRSIPPTLDHIIERCLEKDPDERWQSAFDVSAELKWMLTTASQSPTEAIRGGLSITRRRAPWIFAVCGVLAGAALYATVMQFRRLPSSVDGRVVRAAVPLPPNAQFSAARPSVAISPDGRFLAVVAAVGGNSNLFVRPVDAFEMTPVKGTEGASGPFFSPDGEWIGFLANGRLMKVARAGGTPVVICEAGDVRGASWAKDDTIVFSPQLDSGVFRVSASGGVPAALSVPSAERREKTHRFPEVLPDGQTVMFTIGTQDIGTFDEASIAVQPLAGGPPKVIITGGTAAKYLSTGHVVFARGDSLLAVPFDLNRLETTGSPVAVAQGVAYASDYGRVEYDVSDTGTLVYLPGESTSQQSALVSVDRRGTFTSLTAQPRLFLSVEFSPNGRSLLTIIGGANDTAWIYDIERDLPTRITFRGNVSAASWTPDGHRALLAKTGELTSVAVDGSGSEELLFRDETSKASPQLTPDATALIFDTMQPKTGVDIWTMSLTTRVTSPWLSTSYREVRPRISPDGRWVAYASNESGRDEVYVRPLTSSGGRTQVSRDGGVLPTWSPGSGELVFLSGTSVMAAAVKLDGAQFSVDQPRLLFNLRRRPWDNGVIFDVAPDGNRFVVIEPITTFVPTLAHLVSGWSHEVARTTSGK